MIILAGVSLITSCSKSDRSLDSGSTQALTQERVSRVEGGEFNDSVWTEIDFVHEGVEERLAYADTANFIGQQIYPCARCFLRPEAAQALKLANAKAKLLGLRLLLFDCYRPKEFQKVMFEIVGDPTYVAEPTKKGSMHNRGLAVDLALADAGGEILDFGGEFDDFSAVSHHSYKKLSPLAKENRELLKSIMVEAGFSPYEYEWWHYSYKSVDYEVDGFVWGCN